MTQNAKFCSNCGAPLQPDDRFCAGCGKPLAAAGTTQSAPAPVYAPPPPPAYNPAYNPPPQANIEALAGVIPSVSRRKGFGVESFNIIVTPRRLIFAVMTNDMMTKEAKKVGKEGGFFGGMLNAATVGFNFYKRYLEMTPDAALAESPQNFAVDRARITRVKIAAGKEIQSYARMKANQGSIIKNHQYEQGRLEIETVGEKYTFDLPPSSMEMTVETLRRAGLY
jgi:hypothetical protein